MVKIKRLTLAIILIIAVALGSFATILVLTSGFTDTELVSTEDYENLLEYKTKYAKLERIKDYLLANYYIEVNEEDLIEGMYAGLVDGLDDPYSMYISAEDYEEYLSDLMGTDTYCGVGITFLTTPKDTGYYATSVNSKGPAYAAGVRKGDIICKVNGIDALTMDGDTLRDTIRGEKGTTVEIELIRGSSHYTVTITRAEIPTESVYYEMMEGGEIGYIQISSFISETGTDFSDAIEALEKQGAKGLVIDIRDNGGGLVYSCLQVADALMDKAVVVSTMDHDGNKENYSTTDGKTDLPYVVLVNENSASASEILSAGIQDNKEGILIGTTTYGKGIIQNIFTLSDGSAVKYTELQYLSPSGNTIHKVGITPDIVVELTEDCYDENGWLVNDVQLNRAVEEVKKLF